jgi:hypothetical protein
LWVWGLWARRACAIRVTAAVLKSVTKDVSYYNAKLHEKKFWASLAVLLGSSVVIGSVIVWFAWLAFCFGTVIVGIALLFLAPAILIAPLLIGGRFGLSLIAVGIEGFE